MQNGEKFTFKTKFWEALCQFNLTQNQESIWPMNRVIQNLQCVKCAQRFVLQGNGLLTAKNFSALNMNLFKNHDFCQHGQSVHQIKSVIILNSNITLWNTFFYNSFGVD